MDKDVKPIGVRPQVLLVPTALSAMGSQLFKSMELRDNTSAAKYPVTNPHQGKFRVEVSRYLGNAAFPGQSSKAWYLLAGASDLPVIEVAFLNGQEAPTIETAEQSFNRLGIQMRGYHDFGVRLQDRSVTPLEQVPFRWGYRRVPRAAQGYREEVTKALHADPAGPKWLSGVRQQRAFQHRPT